jgi:glutamyl-tRNA synthetase
MKARPTGVIARPGNSSNAAARPYLYDRTCGTLSFEEQQRLDAEGRSRALRFRLPDQRIAFHDIVHDEISFSHEDFDDFILLRSDGTPTYMVAVVVDDHDMGITHVLRGDDHLSNTPKQIALYHALGYETPMFGHLPLILGADKKRLSKRHGATALGEFQQRGYLPGAMFNFLALLGWSPGDDREIMSRDELVNAFDVRRILKKSSVFDEDKLRWMNGQYIRLLDDETLLDAVMRFRPAELVEASRERVRQLLPLFRERMTVLPEFFDASAFLFHEPTAWDDKAVAKYWKAEAADHLKEMLDDFQTISFDAATLEEYIRTRAAANSVGAGKLIHPLRLALTGAASSPGIFEVMESIGRDGCVRRIRRALAALGDSAGAVV